MDDTTRNKFSQQLGSSQLRQLAILSLFNDAHAELSCSDILNMLKQREGLGNISKRTIQRDMGLLASRYSLEEKQKGKTKLWFRKPGASLRYVLPVLDGSAAAAFLIAEQQLKQLLPASVLDQLKPWFAGSADLLQGEEKGGDEPWYARIAMLPDGLPMMPPHIDGSVLESVYKALRQKCQMKITYRNRQGEEKAHIVNPQGIISARKILYLAATIGDHKEITTFALHRVARSETLPHDPARLLEEGSFQEHVEDEFLQFYHSNDPIPLVADFAPKAAPTLREYRLAEDQELEELEGGWLRVRVSVYDTAQLRNWLLSYGALVRVVGPDSLRRWREEELKAALSPGTAGG